jgi:hypothetical protein
MRKQSLYTLFLLLFCLLPGAQGAEEGPLKCAHWIGAISRADAHIPQGRTYTGGELKKPEVKAAWAAADTLSAKSIYLRREFKLEPHIEKATAYICGLGFYELSINGRKVGDSEFAPLWSDYDKTLFYNTYDVTERLQTGFNAVGVLLGNGFYNAQDSQRYRKLQVSFGPPTLCFRLDVQYADGHSESVISNADWAYSLSPVTYNSIYGGEDYDARLEQRGWDKPRFDLDRWHRVVLQEAPKGVLRPQLGLPVKIMERYDVQTTHRLTPQEVASASRTTKRSVAPSAFVMDMGQNLAGFPEITVRGRQGQRVTLLVSERLTPEGACDQRQTGRPYYYVYTLRGGGEETWHPRFSYYGFRYIQVEGAVMEGEANPDGLPVLRKAQSCFVYNSAPTLSTFECSNPLFNATHRLIDRAVRSNMQSVFTDCPHREKLGWLEEIHLNGPGLLYNYDLRAFGKQIMRDMADAQHPNGAIPTTAPEYTIFPGGGINTFGESPEWGASFIVFPFMYREAYADDSLIREYYDQMRRYIDYLGTRADDHILAFGLGDWYDYGDFRAGFSHNTPVPLVATAHYYMMVDYMKEAALTVGNYYDAKRYVDLAYDIKQAFNRHFYHSDTKQYGTGSQCSNALPLFLDLTPTSTAKAGVLANLVKDVEAHGNRLTTGDVGNRYLIQALARAGRDDVVYRLFAHDDAPGYGFQLKMGATTLTEQWDPRKGASWNHFMMGQIEEWFFASLMGLTTHDGYLTFTIAPQPVGDLTWLKASYRSTFGNIGVSWTHKDGEFNLHLSVPQGSTATVVLPDNDHPQTVGSGEHEFTQPIKKAKGRNQ